MANQRKPSRRKLASSSLIVSIYIAFLRCAHSHAFRPDPIIFRPLKSVTLANTQQRSLLRLAAAGISVYCPHTAVDAASRGNAAWLASLVTEHTQVSSEGFAPAQTALSQGFCVNEDNYVSHGFPAAHIRELQPSRGTLPAFEISAIIPSGRPNASPSGPQAEGMGRLITFNTPVFAGSLLAHLAAELGRPQAFNVAVPYFGQPRSSTDAEKLLVQRIGVCAGSGGSVVSKAQPPADMIITGEMSHHELLACTENGQMVVCLAHSNSERGFLRQIMMPDLKTALGAQNAEVLVSERDADPLTTYVKRS